MAIGITSKMTELRLSFTFIFVTAYVSEIHTLSQKHAEYIRHSYSPARLSQAYANFHDVSLLACAALCGMAEHCIALNFHRSASKCELISETEYFGVSLE